MAGKDAAGSPEIPNVRPLDWVHAVRRAFLARHRGELEQLVLDGMPETPDEVSYRAMLLAVWTFADAKTGKRIHVGHSTLAAMVAVSPATIKRKLKTAREHGWLVQLRKHNNRSPGEYALAIPPGLAEVTSDPDELSTGKVVEVTNDPGDDGRGNLAGVTRPSGRGHETKWRRSLVTPNQGSVDQGGARASSPTVDKPDPTHDGRHPPGNPNRIGCWSCRAEKDQAAAEPTPIPPAFGAAAIRAHGNPYPQAN